MANTTKNSGSKTNAKGSSKGVIAPVEEQNEVRRASKARRAPVKKDVISSAKAEVVSHNLNLESISQIEINDSQIQSLVDSALAESIEIEEIQAPDEIMDPMEIAALDYLNKLIEEDKARELKKAEDARKQEESKKRQAILLESWKKNLHIKDMFLSQGRTPAEVQEFFQTQMGLTLADWKTGRTIPWERPRELTMEELLELDWQKANQSKASLASDLQNLENIFTDLLNGVDCGRLNFRNLWSGPHGLQGCQERFQKLTEQEKESFSAQLTKVEGLMKSSATRAKGGTLPTPTQGVRIEIIKSPKKGTLMVKEIGSGKTWLPANVPSYLKKETEELLASKN